MSDKTEAYFTKDFDRSFGDYAVQDEDVHVDIMASKPHYGLTETQYFSFDVPEHDIHAFLYLWYHPNLKVISGGPIIFQGVKAISLASELFDYRNYLPDSQLGGALTNYTLDSSYSVKMIEPGRTFQIRYDDPSRENRFDVVLTATSEPLVWPGSRHFEQVMHAQGELVLRGKHYTVDAHSVRDRSWGEARLEDPIGIAPISWTTGVFDDQLAFNVTGFDHPELNPLWNDAFTVDPAKVLKFGWLVAEGEKLPLIDARTSTTYNPTSLLPESIELEIVDARNRTYRMKGIITAGVPINTWLNVRSISCLIRWEFEGRIGWGEIIQAQGNDFLQKFTPREGMN